MILCAAYMFITYLPSEVARGLGGPAAPVRYRARGTVDPEVWTWQLICEGGLLVPLDAAE